MLKPIEELSYNNCITDVFNVIVMELMFWFSKIKFVICYIEQTFFDVYFQFLAIKRELDGIFGADIEVVGCCLIFVNWHY